MHQINDYTIYYLKDHLYVINIDYGQNYMSVPIDLKEIYPDYESKIRWNLFAKNKLASYRKNQWLSELVSRLTDIILEHPIFPKDLNEKLTFRFSKLYSYIDLSYEGTSLVPETIEDAAEYLKKFLDENLEMKKESDLMMKCRLKSEAFSETQIDLNKNKETENN